MKDEVINIFTLSLAPEKFQEFKQLVTKIVAATSKEPGTLMYEYSVNDDHTVVHIIERYRADAVVSGVWGAMEPKTNVSSESHRKGAFRSPAHPPGITL